MEYPRRSRRRAPWLTQSRRRYLYQITTAIVPLLIAYGVLDNQVAPLWLGLAASVFATGTAVAHTPREEDAHDGSESVSS